MPEKISKNGKDEEGEPGQEPRYGPGEYRVKIPVDVAKEDIERNFPDLEVREIRYLSEGMGSTAFLVNEELVFRFAKNEKADASAKREIQIMPLIAEKVDLLVPRFEYVGKQNKQFSILGYLKIEGSGLEPKVLEAQEESVKRLLIRQIAIFFEQLQAIDIAAAKGAGAKEENLRSRYENELKDAQEYVYPIIDKVYPEDAERIKAYVEKIFAEYLADEKNFEYKPTFLHGDLEAEHIIFDKRKKRITGIIDWGAVRVGDPDYDLFRPYSHYGNEFLKELLKDYSHSDPDRLRRKLDFFFRAQMIHRVIRSIILKDGEKTSWHLGRFRKQALGIGYWYPELRGE